MPRKQDKENILNSTQTDDSKISLDTTTEPVNDASKVYTKEGLKQKMEDMIAAIDEKCRQKIEELKAAHASLRLSLTKEQLSTPISLERLSDLSAILDDSVLDNVKSAETVKLMTPVTVKRARRSQSSCRGRLATIQESPRIRPGRSSSVGATPKTAKTPMNRTAALNMMNASKYTVKRPLDEKNPIVPVKRIMRAGEEAISTSGSPLFVQSRVPSEPEVNIPLQNGMIMKIDPEHVSSKVYIPHLDDNTKEKIRILCEKLQKCISD